MLQVKGRKVYFNGVESQILGRSSFKLMGHLRWNNLEGAKNWIHHNQELGINLLRVFGETQYWHDHPMFGSPPAISDVWDYNALTRGHRPHSVTSVNDRMLHDLFSLSSQTGMAFEYVVDATMKHATPRNIPWGTIGHCVRQTLRRMRELQKEFPRALIMVSTHNEWNAHSYGSWHADYGNLPADELKERALREVNMQASRARRWTNGHRTEVSFEIPGDGWEPEQWPECALIVDGGGGNDIHYRASTSPHDYCMKTLHPDRGHEWWEVVGRIDIDPFIPTYFSESKLWVDPEDVPRVNQWYRNKSYTSDLVRYEYFINSAIEAGIHFTIHDEKGMQTDSGWPRPLTKLEEVILGGTSVPPPVEHPEFRNIINEECYKAILGREGDKDGLNAWNTNMKRGMSLSEIREAFLRSEEFRNKNFGE